MNDDRARDALELAERVLAHAEREGASESMHRGESHGCLAVLRRGAQHQFCVAHKRGGEPSGGGSGGIPAHLGEQ